MRVKRLRHYAALKGVESMRIGFVSCFDAPDVGGLASQAADEVAGVELAPVKSPELLKVPATAKKMFSEGMEAVVAFVQPGGEEQDEMNLLQEKIIDLEVQYGKYVFLCVVSEGEWKTDKEFEDLFKERLKECLRKAINSAASATHSTAMPDWMPGGPAAGTSEEDKEALDFMEEEVGGKLF